MNSNYWIFWRRTFSAPVTPNNRHFEPPNREAGKWRAARGETSIIPKAQNRANRCKIAHFRIFSYIFSPAENRAENAWFCGGFAGFSRKMRDFGRYAAVPNAIWEHGRD